MRPAILFVVPLLIFSAGLQISAIRVQADQFEGYAGGMFTHSNDPNLVDVTTTTISGHANGTSTLKYSQQLNVRESNQNNVFQDGVGVNVPGDGNSIFGLSIFYSGVLKYTYNFEIGYTSDFYSANYQITQYAQLNSNGYATGIWLNLINTITHQSVDTWTVSIPSQYQTKVSDFQEIIVGYGTLCSGGVCKSQLFCMTGGMGDLTFTGTYEKFGVIMVPENSNVLYTETVRSSNQWTFTNTTPLQGC